MPNTSWWDNTGLAFCLIIKHLVIPYISPALKKASDIPLFSLFFTFSVRRKQAKSSIPLFFGMALSSFLWDGGTRVTGKAHVEVEIENVFLFVEIRTFNNETNLFVLQMCIGINMHYSFPKLHTSPASAAVSIHQIYLGEFSSFISTPITALTKLTLFEPLDVLCQIGTSCDAAAVRALPFIKANLIYYVASQAFCKDEGKHNTRSEYIHLANEKVSGLLAWSKGQPTRPSTKAKSKVAPRQYWEINNRRVAIIQANGEYFERTVQWMNKKQINIEHNLDALTLIQTDIADKF
ncbi:hypothetical protein EGR_05471 [Echinococcus granulosus]|uniref:Uncharacterized protein n=1 Tax=Echinococcus granulosus TaxID=6210 RepID=W6V1G8_ECHGR|nr:hypothetical protein EGR_05471 [Echinococcus granulosus]EUB59709.1 hypothetical protein EGR_05471 [Echinococcus granulosus]